MASSDSSLPAAAGIDTLCRTGTFQQEQQSMIRCVAAAFVYLLLHAGPVHAQGVVAGFRDRIRIAPFFTHAFVATRFEDRVIEFGGVLQPHRAEIDLGPGYGGGLHLEVPIVSPVALFLTGAYVRRESTREYSELEDGTRVETGSDFASARGGLSIRMTQDPGLQLRSVSAALYAGPSFMRELPRPDRFRVGAESVNLYGAHAGFEGELPLGNRSALSVALENSVIWWSDVELGRRNDSVYASIGLETVTGVTSRPTPMWSVRIGLTIVP